MLEQDIFVKKKETLFPAVLVKFPLTTSPSPSLPTMTEKTENRNVTLLGLRSATVLQLGGNKQQN